MMTPTIAAAKVDAKPPHLPFLSLPPSTFAQLQPHSYLLAHLSPSPPSSRPSLRVSGRSCSQFRPASANTGSLTHTNGSAVVRIGDTAVVCGVRAEILATDDIAAWEVSPFVPNKPAATKRTEAESDYDDSEIEAFNLLVPNLSLSTGCAPNFIPGGPPPILAQSLSHQLLSLLHISRLVRAEDLRIWSQPPNLSEAKSRGEDIDTDTHSADIGNREIKAFWTLYIDILIISLAGNPFDAAWAAVVAALRDTRLPRAWWDVDSETVLCSDDVSESRKLSLRGLPLSSSFCVFEADPAVGWRAVVLEGHQKGKGGTSEGHTEPKRWILADPDAFEEALCPERVCVVVDRDPYQAGRVKILRLEKNGGVAVGRDEIKNLVDLAASRWDELRAILEGLG